MDMNPSFKICKHYIQGGLTMRKLFTSLVAASIVASSAFVPLSAIADEKNIDFDEPELYHSVNDYTEKEKQLYELLQRHDPIPLSEIQAIVQAIVGTYEPVSQEEIDAENKYYAEHYGLGSVRGNNDDELNRHSDIGTTIMNVSAEDDVIKNYSYFNSLNREELLEEYNLYCREIGKDEIVPLYITEEGIIKDDFIKNHAINMMKHNFAPTHYRLEPSYKWKAERSSYGWNSKAFLSAVNSKLEAGKLEAGKLEAGRLRADTEYDLSYYGFDKAENDIEEVQVEYDQSRIRIAYQDWTKSVYNNITSIKDAEERVCEFLRCELTLYYSDFFKDFCRNCEGDIPEFDMTWTGCYLSGGSKEFKLDKGDANVDGEVGLADALTILQFIANSQKYPMYEEGFEVADIVGDGDGVTPLDALEIQKWDANIF
ncbi:hypothetical protein SAMN04487832_107163 [Ruminococcus sp. XPD3002]|nr:hypothetical protein SAMN04487832_107163 [Ruminococcus flavefaciens]